MCTTSTQMITCHTVKQKWYQCGLQPKMWIILGECHNCILNKSIQSFNIAYCLLLTCNGQLYSVVTSMFCGFINHQKLRNSIKSTLMDPKFTETFNIICYLFNNNICVLILIALILCIFFFNLEICCYIGTSCVPKF